MTDAPVTVHFEVQTKTADGVITQELHWVDGWGRAHQSIMRQVMDTKEQQIREALISLGWTPPAEG